MIKEKIAVRAVIDGLETLSLSIIYSDLTRDYLTKLDLETELAKNTGLPWWSKGFRDFLNTMENRRSPESKQFIRDLEKSEVNRYITEGLKYSAKDIYNAFTVIIRTRIYSHNLRKEIQKLRNA